MVAHKKLSQGVAHSVPADVRTALTSSASLIAAWESLSPLARNEWLCWIISAKKEETRTQRIQRTREDLQKGKRRPCCWIGCVHRADKPMSASQKYILSRTKRS